MMNPDARNVTPRLLGRAVVGRGLAVTGNLLSRRAGLATDSRSQLLPGVMPETLQAGRGVTISGRMVTVKADVVEYPAKAPETWEMWLWAKIEQRTSHGDTQLDWQRVATVLRGSPLEPSQSLDLQMFDLPPSEGFSGDRHSYIVYFEARRHEANSPIERTSGTETFAVLVLFHEEEQRITGGEDLRTFIREHRLIVQAGAPNRITFQPRAQNQVTYIKVASILRAN